MTTLTTDQLNELRKLYPAAANFILSCQLKNEEDQLKAELSYATGVRKQWILKRLQDFVWLHSK